MDDTYIVNPPIALAEIEKDGTAIGFMLSCDTQTGALLRTLAASKPAGRILEIGTGIGYGSAWLLDGMNATSELISIDSNLAHTEIAFRHLGEDSRATFLTTEASEFVMQTSNQFDLIFADSPVGKFELLEETLALLKPGGFYIVDDLLPKADGPNPGNPVAKVTSYLDKLEQHPELKITRLNWASGLLVAAKIS